MNRSRQINFTLVLIVLIPLLAACSSPQAAPDASLMEVSTDLHQEVDLQGNTLLATYNDPGYQVVDDIESRLVQLYQQANPAVVYVINSSGVSGSGFVYSEDGYIITNHHVIDGARSIEIVFASGDREAAQLVGYDVDGDLAVLKVDVLPEGADPLPLASGDAIQVGQFVVAIGNPFGEQGSMSFGIISALGRSLPSQRTLSTGSTYSLPGVIQTDAPINPGNSGGPLLNLGGEVVGITSAIASDTGTNSGVGFAIPVQAIQAIVPDLITNGKHMYPYIGAGFADEISLEDQEAFGLPQTRGAYVLNVTPGGPADDAGLISADPASGQGGDLVTAIDGVPVADFDDLNRYLVFSTSAGQTVELTVLRSGQERTVTLTLGNRP
jgi:S1-C subfamily serine protease